MPDEESNSKYDVKTTTDYFEKGVMCVVKYSGIITGVSGVVDDLNINKILAGGVLYFAGELFANAVQYRTDVKRFEKLEDTVNSTFKIQ